VFVQTVRHRDYFLPEDAGAGDPDAHAAPPPDRAVRLSLDLLVVALVDVVGLAKIESKPIEDAVGALGAPQSAVGVLIALLVLMPETLAAYRNAARGRVQISLNLAYGSAMASIGLTIPTIAVASIWLAPPFELALGPTQIVLLAVTTGPAVQARRQISSRWSSRSSSRSMRCMTSLEIVPSLRSPTIARRCASSTSRMSRW
jgi:Ca2+:H+ antiporter